MMTLCFERLFLWPDYVSTRQRNIGRARKCSCKFFGEIQQQLEMLQSDPSPAEFAEKTIDYAEAKTAYFMALRVAVPVDQYSTRHLGR
jgi:hypothetical protein